MRILFFLHSFPKISETFILEQVTGLIDNGIDIKIVAGKDPHEPYSHSKYREYNLQDITEYYDDHGHIQRITESFRSFLNLLVYDPYGAFSVLQKASLKDIILLERINRVVNPDIIHAQFGTSGLLISDLINRNVINKKLVTSFHGYDLTSFLQNKNIDTYDKLKSRGHLFLPVNQFLANKLNEIGFPGEKIKVHRMGINPDHFTFSARKPAQRIKLLTVARLVEKKGIYYSIMALKKILSSVNTDIEYNIVGDGILKNYLLELVRKENISDVVKLHGWKKNDEVIEMMKNSHIYILPSVTASDGDMEGTPVSLMEAMASGMPVVSTYHSGIPELVEDGESGLLAKERDPDDLGNKLYSVVTNPEMWSSMGKKGREKIEKEHDIRKLNLDLIDIYNKLLTDFK